MANLIYLHNQRTPLGWYFLKRYPGQFVQDVRFCDTVLLLPPSTSNEDVLVKELNAIDQLLWLTKLRMLVNPDVKPLRWILLSPLEVYSSNEDWLNAPEGALDPMQLEKDWYRYGELNPLARPWLEREWALLRFPWRFDDSIFCLRMGALVGDRAFQYERQVHPYPGVVAQVGSGQQLVDPLPVRVLMYLVNRFLTVPPWYSGVYNITGGTPMPYRHWLKQNYGEGRWVESRWLGRGLNPRHLTLSTKKVERLLLL